MAQQLKRGCPAPFIEALKGHFHPVLMTKADSPDGFEYIHSNFGFISYIGQSWKGLAHLVGWQFPEEGGGIVSSEATVRVAATLSDVLALRIKNIRNLIVTNYIGLTTATGGNVLLTDPVQIFTGYFDSRKSEMRAGDEYSHSMVLTIKTGPNVRLKMRLVHNAEERLANDPTDTSGRHAINAAKNLANPQSW